MGFKESGVFLELQIQQCGAKVKFLEPPLTTTLLSGVLFRVM